MSAPAGAVCGPDGQPILTASGSYLVEVPPEPGGPRLVDAWTRLLDYVGLSSLGHTITDTLVGGQVMELVFDDLLIWQRPLDAKPSLVDWGRLSGLWVSGERILACVDSTRPGDGARRWFHGTGPSPLSELEDPVIAVELGYPHNAASLDGAFYAGADITEHAAVLTDRGLLVR